MVNWLSWQTTYEMKRSEKQKKKKVASVVHLLSFITWLADGLSLNGVRPSAGTGLTAKFDIFVHHFLGHHGYQPMPKGYDILTHWIQAIIWTNAGIFLIGLLGTHFNEILIEIHKFSFKKIHFNIVGKWRPSSLGLSVLMVLTTSD